MQEFSTSEIWEKIESYPYNFIKLEMRNGQSIVPYPSRTATCQQREQQIKTFLESDQTRDGIYILTIRSGAVKSGEHKFPVRVGEITEYEAINDTYEQAKIKSELISDGDLLELRVNLSTLVYENAAKDAEIDRLSIIIDDQEKEIEELTESKALADEATPGGFTWIKDIIPGLADTFFSQRAAQQEIERAKLGLELQKMQMQGPPPPIKKETQNVTLTEIEEFKKHNAAGFYEWLAEPQNAQLYNALSNGEI